MKPFDLEAAKSGKPIVCRDGTPAKFIAHVPETSKDSRVIVLIKRVIYAVDEGGKCVRMKNKTDPLDIFMAPIKHTYWINLYPTPEHTYYHTSKEAADACAGRDRLGGKAWPLEIEE